MPTISITLPADGDTIESSDVNNPINTIVNAINGNLDSNNVSAGGLTPASLVSGTGTSWAWQSWTPTWTNLTAGNGSLTWAKYIQIGKTVHFRIKYAFGSTSSITSSLKFSAPVNQHSDYGTQSTDVVGSGNILDAGNNQYPLVVLVSASNTFEVRPINAASTNAVTGTGTSTTNPFTVGASDVLYVEGTYEAA